MGVSAIRSSHDPCESGGIVFEAAAGWVGGTALVLFCLAAYLPGLASVPPLDGDEARYAEAAREMLAADDWRAVVVPHIAGAPRLNKPPLVYWLQSASAYIYAGGRPASLSYPAGLRHEALGDVTITGSPPTRHLPFTGGIAGYRAPAVVATIAAVLITWRIGLSMFAPTCAWLAAALLAGCFLVVIDARLARTDQVLLACTCAAQWGLWHLWRDRSARIRWVLVFWGGVGLGMLAKGPVTPAVAAFTVAALCVVAGDLALLRRLRIGLGLLILAAVVVPPLALAIASIGAEPLLAAMMQEGLGRGLSAAGGRAGPPGYHLVLLPGLFWPGGLLVVPGFLYAWRRGFRWPWTSHEATTASETKAVGFAFRAAPRVRGVRPGRSAELFCLAWVVPAWIALELIETKLPHYPLPLYPAVALICARAAFAGNSGRLPLQGSRAALLGDGSWLVIGLALTVGVPVALAWGCRLRLDPGVLLGLIAGVIVALVLCWIAFVLIRRRRMVAGLLVGLLASALCGRGLFQTVLPNLGTLWISSQLVHHLATVDPAGERPFAAAGFPRESLVFLTGGGVQRIAPAELANWLRANPRGLAVVPADDAAAPDLAMRVLTTVEGFDYVEGRPTAVRLIESVGR